MKKIPLLLALFISVSVFGQRDNGESVVGLNVGYSLTGGVIKGIDNDLTDASEQNTNLNVLPAFSLTYDYGFSETISLGILLSLQSFSGDVENYSYEDAQGTTVTENVSFGLVRSNISIAPKFHYKLESDNIDLYSGLRMGYIIWNGSAESTDPNFNQFDDFSGGRFNFGIVPLGARFYFGENFGANFEVAIGAPYIGSVGAQYRF